MARSYYLFSHGVLRRKGNTLLLEPIDREEELRLEEEDDPEEQNLSLREEEALPGEAVPAPETAEKESPADAEGPDAREGPVNQPAKTQQKRYIPVEDVLDLHAFGELRLNTRLLNFLGQKGIPLHIYNYYGFYNGSFLPREKNVSGELLVRQVQHYSNAQSRLAIARELVSGAYHNLHRNLVYYRNRGKVEEGFINQIDQEAAAIPLAKTVSELMGVEGRIREIYYRAFNQILKLETPFTRRVRRPPDNLINTLISFGNTLLYSATLTQIYRTPLNPTISFLHEPGSRRYSLALDIAEIFKPLVVDKMIFKLINKQMVNERDLMAETGYSYLKEKARKLIVQEFDRRLQTTVKHRRLRRHVSYRTMIRLECYKLVRHLLNMEAYRALRAWW